MCSVLLLEFLYKIVKKIFINNYALAQIFPEFHTWVRFSMERRNYFEGDMMRGREEILYSDT